MVLGPDLLIVERFINDATTFRSDATVDVEYFSRLVDVYLVCGRRSRFCLGNI